MDKKDPYGPRRYSGELLVARPDGPAGEDDNNCCMAVWLGRDQALGHSGTQALRL